MTTTAEIFTKLFTRDLNSLLREVNAYKNEEDMWKITGEIKNSGGNLALHLVGNLRHFIGFVLGKSTYVRDRESEFSKKNVSRELITKEIETTLLEVNSTLEKMSEKDLAAVFPINVLGYEMSTDYFIAHLYGHLNYHLGQINYHRRLCQKEG